MITTDTVLVSAKDVVSTQVAGEAVLLNLTDGVYYGLDAVGARIWELLQEPRAVHSLRDAIVGEFEVAPDVCENDLIALLASLQERRLVEDVAAGTA